MSETTPATPTSADASALWRRAAARWPLYPFETICLLLTTWSVGFLRYRGMRIDWKTIEYTVYPMLEALPKPLVLGLVLQLVVRALQRRPIGEYLAALRSPRWWWLWLRLWLWLWLWLRVWLWLWLRVTCGGRVRRDGCGSSFGCRLHAARIRRLGLAFGLGTGRVVDVPRRGGRSGGAGQQQAGDRDCGRHRPGRHRRRLARHRRRQGVGVG